MSLNLKDMLFELDSADIHKKLVVEEEEKETGNKREIEGNIQSLSKSTLLMVSKFIAQKIDSVKPPEDKIDKETLKKPLGIIDFQVLKKLSNMPIKGMKISPAQIKGDQIPTLNNIDFKAYEKLQVVPLFITNKELENVGGSKTGEEFAAVFYLPALYSAIRKENVPLHKQMFGVEEPKKGTLLVHTAINKLHYEMVAPEEVEKIQKTFMTGNITPITSIERVQSKRIPTGANEKPGDSKDNESSADNSQESSKEKDEEKVEETFKRYENILLENNERLLEAPAFWEKLKSKFGEKKGEDTNYTFFSEEEIEDSKKSVTQEAGDNKHVYLAKNLGLDPTFAKYIENTDARKYSLAKKDYDVKEINGVEFVKSFKGNFNKLLNNENLIDLNLFNKEIMSKPFSLKFETTKQSPFYINLSLDSDKTVKITSNFFSKTISVTDPFENSKEDRGTQAFFIKPDEQEFSSPQDFTLLFTPSFLNSRFGNEYKKTILDAISKVNNEIKNETFFGKEIDDNIKKSATRYDALKKAIAAFCCAAIKELYYNVNIKVDNKTASVDFVTARIIQFISYKLKNVKLSDLMSTALGEEQSDDGITENESDREVIESFKEKSSPSIFKQTFSKDSISKFIKNLTSVSDDPKDIQEFFIKNEDFFNSIGDLNLTQIVKDYNIVNVSSVFNDFVGAVSYLESVPTKSLKTSEKRNAMRSLNALLEVLEKFGEGEELYKKLVEVCKLANRKRHSLDLFELSFDLSGDITYDEVKKESSPKTKTGLYKSIVESIDSELESISIITNKKLNHKDKDLPFGEELVQRIKSYLAKDSEKGKTRKIDLDDYLTKSLEGSAIDSLVNYNKVIERMKKDSGDLKVLVEKFDDDDFEKHVESELARTLVRSLAGLLGKNSSLLDHKINNKNLINEAASTNLQAGAFVTMLGGVAAGVLGAPVLAAGLAAGAATLGAISMYVKIKEIAAKRKDYAKNPDLFANDVIENAKKVVFQCLKGMIISVHIDALLKHESELKAEGITLVHESAEMQNIYSSFKKESEKKNLKKNLNELGQTIYSEIIDNAYKFKQGTVIGKYINQSSIEKMLINSIFGDTNNPRNKFSSLIKNLQKEGIELKGNQQLIFEHGLKFLLEAEEDAKKSKDRKATYEINKLRLQLSEIITEEFNTLNFKSDIMSALEKEFKKQSQKRAKFFSRQKTRSKESLKAFYFVMKKVLGLSKKEVNGILDMTPEELKQLVGESFNKDFAEIILENKKLSLLLEKDYYLYGSKVGNDVFLKYQTDAKGVDNPLRVIKGTLGADGKIDAASIKIVPEAEMPASNTAHNISKSDAQGFIDQMNTKYSGGEISGGYSKGGLDIKIETPPDTTAAEAQDGFEGPPEELAGPPIEGQGDPQTAGAGAQSPGYTSDEIAIDALNTVSLIMLAIKLGLMAYIRFDKRVLAGAEISKMLKDVNWAVLPGVAFAEIICKTLIKYRKELLEEGINITGDLVEAPKVAGAEQVASSELVNKIRQSMGSKKGELLESEEVTDEMIQNAIQGDLSRICLGIVKKYNKEKYKEIKDASEKDALRSARSGFLGLGNVRDFFSRRSDDVIASKVKSCKVLDDTEKLLLKSTKRDVDEISNVIIAIVKDIKEINTESLQKYELSKLLFEEKIEKHSINITELRDKISSTGVLVYGSDLDPESKEFKDAETYLIGTLANFIETNFDITVNGKEEFKKLNMKKEAAEESVNKDAKQGEVASKEIERMVQGAPVPQNMNVPFDMNQMMSLANVSGGNPMMMFFMMMMMPQFMQMMMQMQQNGSTLQQAVEKTQEVAKKEGFKELTGFDKLIEDAIKYRRDKLPSISVKDVKTIYKNLKTNYLTQKYLEGMEPKFNFDIGNQEEFLDKIQQHVNIDKELPKETDASRAVEKIFYFLNAVTTFNFDRDDKLENKSNNAMIFNRIYAYQLLGLSIENIVYGRDGAPSTLDVIVGEVKKLDLGIVRMTRESKRFINSEYVKVMNESNMLKKEFKNIWSKVLI